MQPELVWAHLFPANVAYALGDGAPSSAMPLQASGEDPRHTVLVVGGRGPMSLPDLRKYHGLVAVVPRDVPVPELLAAGFAHVRRFAMLPSAENVRWLIPLDSPDMSAGALHLYAAVRASARIKHGLARFAARIGSSAWYRAQLIIACREPFPLEGRLADTVGDGAIRLAISSGAPGPVDRRKPSVAIVDTKGALRGVAKFGVSPISEEMVRHESAILNRLATDFPSVPAPRAMFSGIVNGNYTLVQTPLHGRPPGTALTDAHRRFLELLRRNESRPLSLTEWGRALHHRAMCLPAEELELTDLFRTVHERLLGQPLPLAVVHGDFVPWNLRECDGQLTACDWENATVDGVALVDEIHHLLVVGHLMRGWSAERAAVTLRTFARARPLGLEPEVAEALAAACVVEFSIRLIDHGHAHTDSMLVWYRELARRLEVTRSNVASASSADAPGQS